MKQTKIPTGGPAYGTTAVSRLQIQCNRSKLNVDELAIVVKNIKKMFCEL